MIVDNNRTPLEIAEIIASRRGAQSLRLAGQGTEFLFYIATKGRQEEGYRIPHTPEFNTANNRGVSALGLQRQELALATWARNNGIPSAQPLELLEQDRFPVLVLDVVDDDGSELDAGAMGLITARMHQLPPPEMVLVAQNGQSVYTRIAERIEQRYAELCKDLQLPPLPDIARMVSEMELNLGQPILTHLDIRRQNIRVQGGKPHSIFDWSNALMAAPELEIARVEEYAAIAENGIDYEAFCEGYARGGGFVDTGTVAWRILRLDTAVMLAVVFSSVAPNEELRELFLSRIKRILIQL